MKERLHIFPDGVYVYPENYEYAGDYEKWVDASVKVENARIRYEKVFVPAFSEVEIKTLCLNGAEFGAKFNEGQLCETKIEDGKKIVTKIY